MKGECVRFLSKAAEQSTEHDGRMCLVAAKELFCSSYRSAIQYTFVTVCVALTTCHRRPRPFDKEKAAHRTRPFSPHYKMAEVEMGRLHQTNCDIRDF